MEHLYQLNLDETELAFVTALYMTFLQAVAGDTAGAMLSGQSAGALLTNLGEDRMRRFQDRLLALCEATPTYKNMHGLA